MAVARGDVLDPEEGRAGRINLPRVRRRARAARRHVKNGLACTSRVCGETARVAQRKGGGGSRGWWTKDPRPRRAPLLVLPLNTLATCMTGTVRAADRVRAHGIATTPSVGHASRCSSITCTVEPSDSKTVEQRRHRNRTGFQVGGHADELSQRAAVCLRRGARGPGAGSTPDSVPRAHLAARAADGILLCVLLSPGRGARGDAWTCSGMRFAFHPAPSQRPRLRPRARPHQPARRRCRVCSCARALARPARRASPRGARVSPDSRP